jgi:hypothetical protein
LLFLAISLDIPIIQDKKIEIDSNSQMNISFEETISLENSLSNQIISIQSTLDDSSSSLSIEDQSNTSPINDISPNILSSDIMDQSIEIPSIDDPNECVMSDNSSDTVDYDFDTETSAALKF